jgi:hypothetical protein
LQAVVTKRLHGYDRHEESLKRGEGVIPCHEPLSPSHILYSVPAIVIIQTIIYENAAIHATDMIKVNGYNFRQRPGSLQSGTVTPAKRIISESKSGMYKWSIGRRC